MKLINADALEQDGWSMSRTIQVDEKTMELQTKKPTDFPAIEPRKGRWIHDGYDIPHGVDWMHCSICGRREPHVPAAMTNFCPDCGAWMLKESEPEYTMEEFMYEQDLGNPEDGSL